MVGCRNAGSAAVPLRLSLSGGRGTRTLSSGTLSIGRGEGNGWVLPDPERHLSKTHCVISIESGQWILTDLSTNGVYINGARQPTMRDSRIVLTDGDEFRIGEHSFVAEDAPEPRGTSAGMAATHDGDPLDIDPLDDPLGAPMPRDAGFSHPVRHAAPSTRGDDPFDREDDARHRPADPDSDLFRGIKPAVDWTGPSQSDHADAPRHAMALPRVVQPVNMGEIDFDALIGDLSDLQPGRPATPPPAPPPAAPVARQTPPPAAAPPPSVNPFDSFDAFIDDPAGVPNSAPTPPPPPSSPPPAARFAPVQPEPAPAPAPVAPAPAAAAAAAPVVAPAEAMQAAMRAFLEGAGVASLPKAGDPEAAIRAWGQMFRVMTEGLREVLMSRAAVKGELQVEQTMIKATNNNPLKFSMSPDDAVMALLMTGRTGYMQPLAAAREAFDDIKTHELAVMAGVQTALVGLLRRFDPDALESRLIAGKLESLMPAARKARLWESFRNTYKTIASEAEDDFQAVFGRAFAKAYMAQTRKD